MSHNNKKFPTVCDSSDRFPTLGMRYICDNGEQRNEPEYRIPDADAFRTHRNSPLFGVVASVDPNLDNVFRKGAERSQWEGGGKHCRKAKLNRQLDVV